MNAVAPLASLSSIAGFDADAQEQILLEMGVKLSHVQIALSRAKMTGEPLSTIMRDFGFLSGERVAEALSHLTGLAHFTAEQADKIDPKELAGISLPQFRKFVPVGKAHNGALIVAVPDPSAVNDAKNAFAPRQTSVCIASEHIVQSLYRKYFANTAEAFDTSLNACRANAEASRRGEEENASAMRVLFMALLRHACYSGASDIYLYKTESTGLIKLKINGVGQMFRVIEGEILDRLINKLVSENSKRDDVMKEPKEAVVEIKKEDARNNEDIAGRFGFRLELASSRGEVEAVIRILDKQSSSTDLDRLGFDPDTYKAIQRISKTSTGLFLVTGPTGSGKTTTLYAVLKGIDPVERSVQSIENPIEYRHGLWQQHELSKTTTDEGDEYRKWLKALLRNAPDVILVGEVRDSGVAKILLDAANTGHLAFSTLHTNNAAMALARLKALGLDMSIVASILLGILAQRLVRLLCPRCSVADDSLETAEVVDAHVKAHGAGGARTLRKAGPGCVFCGHTGYRGRRMLYELLEVTPNVQELIEQDALPSVIARKGIKSGRTMWATGLSLVCEGLTSVEELQRVAKADVAADGVA